MCNNVISRNVLQCCACRGRETETWRIVRKFSNEIMADEHAKMLNRLYEGLYKFRAKFLGSGMEYNLREFLTTDGTEKLRDIPRRLAEQAHDAVIKNMIVTTLKG